MNDRPGRAVCYRSGLGVVTPLVTAFVTPNALKSLGYLHVLPRYASPRARVIHTRARERMRV